MSLEADATHLPNHIIDILPEEGGGGTVCRPRWNQG